MGEMADFSLEQQMWPEDYHWGTSFHLEEEEDMTPVKKQPAFGKPKAAAQDGTFKFQLPDTLGSGRGRIPKGKYVGRCVSIVPDTSKSSGNPMWTWVFIITAGPYAGRDFKLWTVLTDDAAWKIAETLKGLGLEANEGEEISIKKSDVIGVGCTMHIKDDSGIDGDGEFSKLDKISAHPKGAGYKAGKLAAAEPEPEEEEEDADGMPVDEEETDDFSGAEEEPEPPRRPAKKPAPKAPAKGGKAPASLGKRK